MKENVQRVLSEIRTKIVWLQDLESRLASFLNDDAGADAGAPPPPAKSGRRLKQIPADASSKPELVRKGVSVPEAFRQVIAGWAGEFTSKMVAAQAIARFPEITDKIKIAASVTMKALMKSGEVTRMGSGKTAVYKRISKSA
jgi:hypothetical protein